MEKITTPTRPQLTSSAYFCLFAKKAGKTVDQSEHALYKSAISKQNEKRTALHQGWQWAFKFSWVFQPSQGN